MSPREKALLFAGQPDYAMMLWQGGAQVKQAIEAAMGPVPEGWEQGERVGEWVRTGPGAPVTVRLVSPAGHAPEWQVRAGGRLVAQVSDRAAALALGWSGGSRGGGGAQHAAEVSPPAVDPWKAFGLAVLAELKPPNGDEPLVFLAAVCRTAALVQRAAEDAIDARARADELQTKLDRYATSAPEKMSGLPLEVWHRVTSPQGNCAVLELQTEGGRILSRREVVESDRRDIQLAKVDDLMSTAAKGAKS